MTLSVPRVRHYLQNDELEKLFIEELGWDQNTLSLDVQVEGRTYTLQGIAEKRGVQILRCLPDSTETVPAYNIRQKIEKQVTKSAYEHLIIFVDADKAVQIWQWVARQPGQPAAYREHSYYPHQQSGDALVQKLNAITIPLDEEEALDLTGTLHKLRDAFDRDRITKLFYEQFKEEHGAFLEFVKGITEQGDREWYASLMLNRLMFIYFIQRKGFLDGDTDYLRNRLQVLQQRKGRDKFLTFYRYFLLALFHEGFAKQPQDRKLDPDLLALLGQVPYLNGGLFEVHQLEEAYPKIDIPDEAFENLFAFFDTWDWTLDTRPLRNDREINPDVLGYIFEKYINQKEMGAYYTKEDITDYISKNTILPHLFDVARKKCAVAFQPGSALWQLLQDDPDRYIYPAVRQGVIDEHDEVIPESALPEFVREGMHDPKARMFNKEYNLRQATIPDGAGNNLALPTETWREYVMRRQRCLELREKLQAGTVHEINDLITHNLNIRQFAEDAITTCEGPELLRAFYQAISSVTVLDPTCGSGAFLFAALNILEPLYEACLDRMQAFVEDLERSGERHSPKKFSDFRKTLNEITLHPNRTYFILKSIIVNNLYGVDIMEEAVEICKLRLFLKLVAQVDKVKDLEPLPDVDFNIRAGNTLVGFVSLEEIRRAAEEDGAQLRMISSQTEQALRRIEEEAEIVERAFQKFHEMQTQHGMNARDFSSRKQKLRQQLKRLTEELDHYLAREYNVNVTNPKLFAEWRKSHQPFHWFAEFYGIMQNGGFNIVLGNPPWREYAKVRKIYRIQGYPTEPCGNLHGICTERALSLRSIPGRISFIVQLPLTCSSRMKPVRSILSDRSKELHIVPFDDRPGKLFEGLQHCRSVIFLSEASHNPTARLLTTRYQRWPTETRPFLFSQFEYANTSSAVLHPGLFPKYATNIEVSAFTKVRSRSDTTIERMINNRETKSFIFYQEATQYWVKATLGLPYYAKDGVVGAPAHGRYIFFDNLATTAMVCAILNSSLFYVYFIAYGDCFHLSDTVVTTFPVPRAVVTEERLQSLGSELQNSFTQNALHKTIQTRDGSEISYAEFYASKSKPIIDEIDQILAEHYKFTDEELDFIVNYDVKYRLGSNDEAEG